ncbi:MAG: DcrB-related protein [Enterobacteriaceae bacterium]|nr:DcrB-related protein [Enterobacteriaceae bacterium]
MENYTLPEVILPFPGENWLDKSMNIFRHPDTQSSVVITRGRCAYERSLDEELDAQWRHLESMTEQFDLAPRENVVLPGCPQTPARIMRCSFIRSGMVYHQWQLALLLSDKTSTLIITQTTLNEPDEQDLYYREKLKQEIRLTR